MESADLIIMRDNLTAVPTAITLARRTYLTIRTNLVWAFGYNVIAIPLAAFGFLNPLIAGAAMALSSGCVVWNSSRLRHFSTDVQRKAEQVTRPDCVVPHRLHLPLKPGVCTGQDGECGPSLLI